MDPCSSSSSLKTVVNNILSSQDMIYLSSFFGTLLVGVTEGIVFPVTLSLIVLIYDATKIRIKRMGRLPRTKIWKDQRAWGSAKNVTGVVVLQLVGNPTFANADDFMDVLQAEVADIENSEDV